MQKYKNWMQNIGKIFDSEIRLWCKVFDKDAKYRKIVKKSNDNRYI